MSLPAVSLSLSAWLFLFSSTLSHYPGSTKTSGCFKVNNCQCIMKDGSGLINLDTMGDEDGFLGRLRPVSAEDMEDTDEMLFSFSPCHPFSQSEDVTGSDCNEIAVSLVIRHHRQDKHISRCIGYGRHEGNQFYYNQTLRTLSVSYFAHEERPLTVVHYHCNPNLTVSFIRAQSLSAEEPLQIWVESPCACPNACSMGDLGLGTIFLVILSLSAAAYFILGSCALRPFRSSSGVQIAPEHSVWCMICYLCAERRPVRRRDTDTTCREP